LTLLPIFAPTALPSPFPTVKPTAAAMDAILMMIGIGFGLLVKYCGKETGVDSDSQSQLPPGEVSLHAIY